MKIKPEILDRAVEIVSEDEEYLGICLSCGHEQDSCEPDAREYVCENCEQKTVYGAQEILIMGVP